MSPLEAQLAVITQTVRETMETCPALIQPWEFLVPSAPASEASQRLMRYLAVLVHREVFVPMCRGTQDGQIQPSKRAVQNLITALTTA